MIDYYDPVHFPITLYKTVEELLKRSQEATKAIGQEYVSTHLTWMCAWRPFPWYSKLIIFPGPFHTKINFIGILTKKKARGSGYDEILIEAKLVTSGNLVSVLSRKAYSKALFNLKAVVEALERLLFEVFAEENDIEIRPEALLNLINACSSSFCLEQLDQVLPNEPVTHITNK